MNRDPETSSSETSATGISADGTKVSGRKYVWYPSGHPKFGPEMEAAVFTKSGGTWSINLLGDLGETPPSKNSSNALGISGSGRPWGVGSGQVEGYYQSWPLLFDPLTMFPKVPNVYNYPTVTAVNYDGTKAVGYGSGSFTDNPFGASQTYWYRWNNGAIQLFSPVGNGGGHPLAMSWDGTVFTGWSWNDPTDTYQVWRYRDSAGTIDYLPKPIGFEFFSPLCISGNGNVIAGYGSVGVTDYAWYYSDATGMVVVSPAPGLEETRFMASNQDGSVLVGQGYGAGVGDPVLWTKQSGLINLTDYLIQNGIDLTNFNMRDATGVSADGRTICGNAHYTNPETGDTEQVGWVATIDLPQGITTFNVNPSEAVGGTVANAVLGLFKTATQDEIVTFSTTHPALVGIPASIIIGSGTIGTNFDFSTAAVSEDTTVTISAQSGTATHSRTIKLLAPRLKSLRITYPGSPTPLEAGKTAYATVNLTGIAPSGGVTVKLWDNTASFELPNSEAEALTVMVPEGETFVKVPVKTKPSATDLTRFISTRVGDQTATAPLSIRPWYTVAGLTVSPTTIQSGGSATGKVKINLPARAGGEVVTVTSGNPAVVIPSTVTVLEGQTLKEFPITAASVSATVKTWVKVSMGGVTKYVDVTVKAPALQSVSVAPSFTGGEAVSCTITLTGTAASDLTIKLRDNTGYLDTPATVTIPAGSESVTISINSSAVPSTQAGKKLIASLNGVSKSATFTINP